MGNLCGAQAGGAQVSDAFVVPEANGGSRVVRANGWRRDAPDFRDRVLALREEHTANLPPKKDLRGEEHFDLYDQGSLGSCTANALAAAFHFDQIRQGLEPFAPSRLFIYYNEREIEGTVGEDSGAMIRDGIKCLASKGVCEERAWPYKTDTFTAKPSASCYELALKNKAKAYARVPQTLHEMKGCINQGFPFVFGFMVLSSFLTPEVAQTGEMKMPGPYDFVRGGHAVMCVGYDDEREVFIVRNSWGENWGDRGYFYMPYSYMTHQALSQDHWVIKFVDGVEFPCRGLA